jgi:hypothetical protein
MSKAEILESLDGCEVMSIMHEGVVLIDGSFGWQDGEKFKLTSEDATNLWDAYKFQNGF